MRGPGREKEGTAAEREKGREMWIETEEMERGWGEGEGEEERGAPFPFPPPLPPHTKPLHGKSFKNHSFLMTQHRKTSFSP